MTDVVGLGAGGHAKVVIEILRTDPRVRVVGLLDPELKDKKVLGVPVLGPDTLLPRLARRGVHGFFVGVGSTRDTSLRLRLHETALRLGLRPVSAVHPSAIVSPSACLGPGVQVMAGAVINAETRIGAGSCVNTGAVVEHDCTIGPHVYIATGARVCGAVRIGRGAFIGAGAVIRQSVTIGARATVAAGAVVVGPVRPATLVAGVPARPAASAP
jgi:UDP-perosamine 4-acetyltransferase